jgi:hypothetical protein
MMTESRQRRSIEVIVMNRIYAIVIWGLRDMLYQKSEVV